MASSCGTITVEPAFDPSLVSVSCDLGRSSATAGDSVPITATITNNNDAFATYTVTFEIGSATTEQVTGSVAGGRSEEETISVQLQNEGSYPVSVSVSAQEA